VFLGGLEDEEHEVMSTTAITQAHIAYELIDEQDPEVVAIEFLSHEIASPRHASELGEQLNSLIRPELPRHYVIDFGNVRSLGSTAFGAIVAFVRRAGRVRVCNMQHTLRLGAALIGLDDHAEFIADRQAAIRAARRDARRDEEDTVDYPDSSD
jgi:anti-anti-sigma regulatory factor